MKRVSFHLFKDRRGVWCASVEQYGGRGVSYPVKVPGMILAALTYLEHLAAEQIDPMERP